MKYICFLCACISFGWALNLFIGKGDMTGGFMNLFAFFANVVGFIHLNKEEV